MSLFKSPYINNKALFVSNTNLYTSTSHLQAITERTRDYDQSIPSIEYINKLNFLNNSVDINKLKNLEEIEIYLIGNKSVYYASEIAIKEIRLADYVSKLDSIKI